MSHPLHSLTLRVAFAFALAGLAGCSSSDSGDGAVACSSLKSNTVATADDDTCYPDNDGINDDTYNIEIAVNDDGFTSTGGDNDGGTAKNIISTQNESQVTLTLRNDGTKPHGFTVGCVSVCSSYPTLPKGCSPKACFPKGATIDPIDPGASKTVTFSTPTPDNLIYPFSSGAPGDDSVPGLNGGQWSLM
ncbi:MAG TPA: hypothetical protein VHC69_29560 [Polyangiaceae bacterium]|nr:hypothetical protein [Polyangiaceae bacterium]